MMDPADDERAAIRESVLARSVRTEVQRHLRTLFYARWPRARVEALVRQALDDAAREAITVRLDRAC